VKRMGTKEARTLSSPREHWRFRGALDAVSEFRTMETFEFSTKASNA
jgi:hypothetical protein